MNTLNEQFTTPLLDWYEKHGRKNLPWQLPRSPYNVWISEIMLQQTQVQTVIPYFNRFMQEFPTIGHLAAAEEDRVLSLWSGLGYYSRARNLHKTAIIIHTDYAGVIPAAIDKLIKMPGIGLSTAAAILSQAYNLPEAILDGNVKRVLTRFFGIKGVPEQASIKKLLWDRAAQCMHKERCADYTQAIMDLGATCCTLKKPNCSQCPVAAHCHAHLNQEQHLYPTKKTKKPLPIHQQQFLLLINDCNKVYLEKRPPTGVWGGLWCVPSIDKGDCPLTYIRQNYDAQGCPPQHLITLKHRFSHFLLEIDAIVIKTTIHTNKIAESSGQWFEKEQLHQVGLAKPTQHILSYLFNSNKILDKQ